MNKSGHGEMLAQPKIADAIAGREPRKLIYVPGRLIKIVV
jgi:hypothetical protein